jgi:hypothetical protein
MSAPKASGKATIKAPVTLAWDLTFAWQIDQYYRRTYGCRYDCACEANKQRRRERG